MTVDTPLIPPEGEQKKKIKWLWGCLIALVLVLVIICCGATLIFMPLFTDIDLLGTGLRDRIEEYIPMDYQDDSSLPPEFEELLEEEVFTEVETPAPEEITQAEDIPLAIFNFLDIGTSFSYPVGWNIEMEGYGVTFYDPDSYTYIYMGEDIIDPETTAEQIGLDILDKIQEEAQEGSFNLISSDPYLVPIPGDAYLTLFEWVDQDGYYTWAYDLEIVSGESNIYIFLSGEDPDEVLFYGDLLDIIASSLESMQDVESSEDA